MPGNREYRDPEIAALSQQIHGLTEQIRTLVVQIDDTVIALETYAGRERDRRGEN